MGVGESEGSDLKQRVLLNPNVCPAMHNKEGLKGQVNDIYDIHVSTSQESLSNSNLLFSLLHSPIKR